MWRLGLLLGPSDASAPCIPRVASRTFSRWMLARGSKTVLLLASIRLGLGASRAASGVVHPRLLPVGRAPQPTSQPQHMPHTARSSSAACCAVLSLSAFLLPVSPDFASNPILTGRCKSRMVQRCVGRRSQAASRSTVQPYRQGLPDRPTLWGAWRRHLSLGCPWLSYRAIIPSKSMATVFPAQQAHAFQVIGRVASPCLHLLLRVHATLT